MPAFHWRDTIVSQMGNSPTVLRLLESTSEYLDPTADLDRFYNLVWNVDTAQGYGLDVWGRIVGVSRIINVADVQYFGFQQGHAETFGHGPFYSGETITHNFALSDTAFRLLILAKALANICDGSIPGINRVLMLLFPGRGNCHVTDGLDMTMTYTFHFFLTGVERAIILQTGVLPRPAGVSFTIVEV